MLSPGASLFAALVFAVHPAASEAAVSIGYREDMLVCCFALASLLLTLRGGRGPRLAALAAYALAAYALALFSKENAAVLPGLLVLTRLTVARDGPLDVRALTRAVPRIFAHYLHALVVPAPLMVLYAGVFPFGGSWIEQLPWVALDLAVLAGAVKLARARPALGLGVLWFALALAPTLHVVPMRVSAADRFMYLSMVGGAIAAGAAVEMAIAAARRPARRRLAWAGAGAALLALLVLTEQRVAVWRVDVSLWTDTLRHNPHAYIGHFVLGATFDQHGQPQEARHELEAALAECPRESTFGREHFCAHYAVSAGFVRIRTHDLEGAWEAFELSPDYLKDNVPAIVGLGYVDVFQGNLAEARREAERAARLTADDPHGQTTLDRFRDVLRQAERDGAGGVPVPMSDSRLATTASR